jgi:hypothetical protein
MGKISFKAVKGASFIPAGKHVVEIISTAEVVSASGNKQIKVVFKDDKGRMITHYYNTIAYERNADKSYKLDKKGDKIISEELSEKTLAIIGKLACNAGIDEDEEITADDLVGKEVGICVVMEIATEGESAGKEFARVHYSFEPSEIEVDF